MDKKKVVVALGDSITYGYPYTPDGSWTENLKRETNYRVINSGVPGDTFHDMLARLDKDVLIYNPDIVIVMGGTNDVYVGCSQPQIQAHFRTIIDQLRESNIKIILGLPLPVADSSETSLKALRKWLLSYGENNGIAIIDFYKDFLDNKGEIREDLYVDGCHPNKIGYNIMAKRVVTSIKII